MALRIELVPRFFGLRASEPYTVLAGLLVLLGPRLGFARFVEIDRFDQITLRDARFAIAPWPMKSRRFHDIWGLRQGAALWLRLGP